MAQRSKPSVNYSVQQSSDGGTVVSVHHCTRKSWSMTTIIAISGVTRPGEGGKE